MSKHPLQPVTRPELLDRIRELVARLPETSEKLAWGEATFRVGKAQNMFAMFSDNHHNDGRIALLCKAPPGVQEMLVEAEPERFFRPPYVGPSGWIGIRVDGRSVDWEEVGDFLADAWRMTASRKLVAAADAPPASKATAKPKTAKATSKPKRSAR
jgi:hypothetical protein